MTNKTGQELCLLLKFPYGFIPSVASPILKFLDSAPKSGNVSSILFHWGESAGCRRRLSHFLPSACHVRFFASSLTPNNLLNLGTIGKYHKTLAEGPSVSSSPFLPSNFFLNRDNPHVGHTFNVAKSFLYNTNHIIRRYA